MKNALITVAISAAVLASPLTNAYEGGDIIVRAGFASVQPNDSVTGTLDTLNASVGSDTQLGLTATYMLSDKLGLELLAATPFKHKISLDGGKGEAKQLPPTLSLQYYPMASKSRYQPYVGLGINYTKFFEEKSTLGDLKLSDSWGASVQAGVDYQISEHMLLNAAVWYMDIDSDATLNGGDIGSAKIDPWVYMVGVGYKF